MLDRVTLLSPIALAAFLSSSAASDRLAPIYRPWTKTCFNETCLIGSDFGTECGPIFGVVLIETAQDTKKILRMSFSNSVNTEPGVRIAIGEANPITRPFKSCYASGCVADYEAGAELVDRLKQGRTLRVGAVDAANSPISLSFPLVGFATAYDGPAQIPKLFEDQPGQLEKELRAHEDDRKVRCQAK